MSTTFTTTPTIESTFGVGGEGVTDGSGTLKETLDGLLAIADETKDAVAALENADGSKASVKACSTATVSRSGSRTVDGVSCTAGDLVLLVAQSDATQNGVYQVAAGSWTRAAGFDTDASMSAGSRIYVERGTINAKTDWVLTTTGAIDLDTTSLAFARANKAPHVFEYSGSKTAVTGTGVSNDLLVAEIQIPKAYLALNSRLEVRALAKSVTVAGTGNHKLKLTVHTAATVADGTVIAGGADADPSVAALGEVSFNGVFSAVGASGKIDGYGLAFYISSPGQTECDQLAFDTTATDVFVKVLWAGPTGDTVQLRNFVARLYPA